MILDKITFSFDFPSCVSGMIFLFESLKNKIKSSHLEVMYEKDSSGKCLTFFIEILTQFLLLNVTYFRNIYIYIKEKYFPLTNPCNCHRKWHAKMCVEM